MTRIGVTSWGQAAYGLITTPPATFSPMARKPSLDFSGAFFHVLARGNRRATIFHDDADYHAYSIRVPAPLAVCDPMASGSSSGLDRVIPPSP